MQASYAGQLLCTLLGLTAIEAEHNVARCVELQPLSAAAHQALGLVAEARGDLDEAVSALELALELTACDNRPVGEPGPCSMAVKF